MDSRKSIWLMGPLGYGHLIEVDGMPEEDGLKQVESYLLTFGDDAAMAARALGPEWERTLIGNRIANNLYGVAMRELFVSAGVELLEITSPPKGPSCAIIIVNRRTDTRTVFSNIRPPSMHEFSASLKDLSRTRALPTWIYFDDFSGIPGTAFRDLTRLGPKVLYNIGDITAAESVPSIVASESLIVLQMSLKGMKGSCDKHLALLSDRSTSDLGGTIICVTSGSNPVIIIRNGQAASVPVTPVRGVNTAGAGAVFSRFLLDGLEDSRAQIGCDTTDLAPSIEYACRSTRSYLSSVLAGKTSLTCQLETSAITTFYPTQRTKVESIEQ